MSGNLRLSGVKFQKSRKVGLVGLIIRQMKLLTSSFQKTIFKVIQGHSRSKMTKKGQKGQILNLLQNSQIIPQNEALDIVFSAKILSRSFRVTQGQKYRKKVKEVKF